MPTECVDPAGPTGHPPDEHARRSAGSPLVVTLVHAPACHLCEDADELLTRTAEAYGRDEPGSGPPIVIERVDIRSAEGRRLTALHRPPMNPLVLVDGRFFASGRLPRGKLRRFLERRTAEAREDASSRSTRPAGV